MEKIYYIPHLAEMVLLTGTKIIEGKLYATIDADDKIKDEVEKLTYKDLIYIGDLK